MLVWSDTWYPPDHLGRISGRLPDIRPDNWILQSSAKKFCNKTFNYNSITVGPFVCMSVQTSIYYACLSVSPSICNIYVLLLTYCYRTNNLRNYAFVSLFKGIFVVNYKRFKLSDIQHYLISGPALLIILLNRKIIVMFK